MAEFGVGKGERKSKHRRQPQIIVRGLHVRVLYLGVAGLRSSYTFYILRVGQNRGFISPPSSRTRPRSFRFRRNQQT